MRSYRSRPETVGEAAYWSADGRTATVGGVRVRRRAYAAAAVALRTATPAAAAEFIERAEFVWHQRWELAPGVWTPGSSDVGWLCHLAKLPADLTGQSVIDVGTTNAGTAFELERRGASRVVAVDIF